MILDSKTEGTIRPCNRSIPAVSGTQTGSITTGFSPKKSDLVVKPVMAINFSDPVPTGYPLEFGTDSGIECPLEPILEPGTR